MIIIIIGIIAFILYSCQGFIYKKAWNSNLNISLQFNDRSIIEGEDGTLNEVIENNKLLPLPILKVKFQCARQLRFRDSLETSVTDLYYRNDIFCIMPYQKVTRKLDFTGTKRGYYSIKGVDLVGSDLFLSKEMNQGIPLEKNLYVYPRRINRREILSVLMQINGEMEVKRHYLEDPFIYRGIREYQNGDGLKSINWKATARTGEFKVNQKGYTSRNSVKLFLNLEDNGVLKKENQVENTIRLTVTLAQEFLAKGMRVAVYANGVEGTSGRELSLKSNSGATHLEAINQCLAKIDTSKGTKNFKECFFKELFHEERESMVLFLSPNTYQDFQKLIQEFADTGNSFYWLLVVEKKDEMGLNDSLKGRVMQIVINQEE